MKIKKIGILKEEDIKGDNKLETIIQSGALCQCSDLARLTGVQYNQSTGFGEYWFDGQHRVYDNKTKKNIFYNMNYINLNCTPISINRTDYKAGVRIAFSFDDIEEFDLNELENLNLEYPLTIIGGIVGKTLDNLFNKRSKLILTTGKKHFVDGKEYREYEAFGIRFIRKRNKEKSKLLSDGTSAEADTDVYLKIETIPLTIEEKARLVYSNIILFGANFDKEARKFSDSDLNKYLNGMFLKSLNDELEHSQPTLLFNEKEQELKNRYGFNFSSLTEEEIVEICINSNIAVFLHGKTGVGKTEVFCTKWHKIKI